MSKLSNLLSKILQKRGIERVEDLTIEERADFDNWQRILAGAEVTLETVKEFCRHQIKEIERQLGEPDNSTEKTGKLGLILNVYLNILRAIEAPEAEKENLEKYLNQLLK